MTEGAQKFISRNRAPRVQIEYDIELYGSAKNVQLPFVMGVMADLTGKSKLAQPSIESRDFLEIDVDNFDDRMRGMQPRTAFSVPNTLTGEDHLEVDLTFESLDDFSPQAIAEKVAPLRTLLEARNQLTHLMTYMDGKSRAETLIENILANPKLLELLAGDAPENGVQENAQKKATLEALRSMTARAAGETDQTNDVLEALKSSAAPATDTVRSSDDILADLSPQETPENASEDTANSVLASLRSDGTGDPSPDTGAADTLAALVAKSPSAEPNESPVDQTLQALTQPEIPQEEHDKSNAILDDLAALGHDDASPEGDTESILGDLANLENVPADQDNDDAVNSALAHLAENAPEDAEQADQISDVLSGLEDTQTTAPEPDTIADTLANIVDGTAGTMDAATDIDADLESLVQPVKPEEEPSEDDLAGLADIDLDDLLDDLAVPDADASATELEEQPNSSSGTHPKDPDSLDELGSDDNDDASADLEVNLEALDDLLETDADQMADPTAGSEVFLDDLLDGGEARTEKPEQPTSTGAENEMDTDTIQTTQPEFAFGIMSAERPDPAKYARKRFRIALLGDFSGRSARGQVEIGDGLANRAPVLLDPDTIEDVIKGFGTTLVLPIGKDGAGVEVRLDELDDLHPDELYEKCGILYELRNLKSQLASGATVASATEKLKAWGEAYGTPVAPPKIRSGGNAVPAHLKLTEFQKLIGDTDNHLSDASPVEDMIARIVGPFVQSATGGETEALSNAVDNALSGALRLILHHPEFQSIEAQWRSLDLIARRIETDDQLEVMLYDVSAEEIAADLAAADELSGSGLARMLTEAPMNPETGRGGYSAVFGLYTFEETPPHADLLGRIARVAAHMDAPFIAALSTGFMETAKEDRHPLVAQTWDTLRAMPEAEYLGLVAPRFLLRRPYGAKSEPIYEFDFEEFTMSEGLRGMLWANPVVLVMILMAKSFQENGAHLGLGSVMQMGDMPYHFVTDTFGDQVALPCTERNLTLDRVEKVMARGVMPVVSIKGRDEIRLASFQSLAGGDIRGPWTGTPPPEPSPPQAVSEPVTVEPSKDDDDLGLDDLLAGFDDDAPDSPADDLDADLAALLEDL